jgi:hypothetical protein
MEVLCERKQANDADLMNLLLSLLPSKIYHDVRRVQTLAWALVGICMTQTVRSRCLGRNS